jgi:hypothetical protein
MTFHEDLRNQIKGNFLSKNPEWFGKLAVLGFEKSSGIKATFPL